MILYKKLLDIDRKGTMSKAMTPVYKLKKKINKYMYRMESKHWLKKIYLYLKDY